MTQQEQTDYVGMSGGVDSSLAAAFLKEAGYKVVGVFIRAWEAPKVACTWRDDRRDAMRVAAQLEIPFKTLDLSREYKTEVVDYLIAEYKEGRTPNPDVMCNRSIKFGAFFDWAVKNGADYVATGHYAQIKKGDQGYKMLTGEDKEKDQTYFLWMLKKDKLNQVLFPIGHLNKDTVRQEAEKRNLYTASKKDSQGVCFLGKLNMTEFLQNYLDVKQGPVVNDQGESIGVHNGVYFYTLGQRHGFTVTRKTKFDLPYYVIAKNVNTNTLIVSQQKKDLPQTETSKMVDLKNVNWLNKAPVKNEIYYCRYRYRGKLIPCSVFKTDKGWQVELSEGKNDIAPGQSVVIYKAGECLGGGVVV